MSRTDAFVVIAAAALWVCLAGLLWGTWAASGADSYGYVSESQLLLDGSLVLDQPLARQVPWEDADWTFSPLGYRPGLDPGTIVPVYPVGLPLVMALFQLVGGPQAVFFVVPLLGLVTVLASAGLATRMSGLTGGAVTALLIAASPTMLYAVMWPMSDVAAAAWWAVALFLASGAGPRSAAGSGFATGLAILTRPNLVGVALAPGLYFASRAWNARGDRRALTCLGLFAVPAVTGCLAVAFLHTWLYGSPILSGHGELNELFSASIAPGNIVGFGVRLLSVEPVLVLLGLLGAGVALTGRDTDERSEARPIGWLCLGVTVLVLASYLFYFSYPEWWYLRFLLPAYSAMAVLGGAGAAWIAQRLPEVSRTIVLSLIVATTVLFSIYFSQREGILGVGAAERRYPAVGRFVDQRLPENAVLFAFHQSGSLRYYSGRLTLRFDLLGSEWLEAAVSTLSTLGYRPYFVIDEDDDPSLGDRFRASTPLGLLDWPPVARFEGVVDVEIYDPADRPRWLAGEQISTQSIEP